MASSLAPSASMQPSHFALFRPSGHCCLVPANLASLFPLATEPLREVRSAQEIDVPNPQEDKPWDQFLEYSCDKRREGPMLERLCLEPQTALGDDGAPEQLHGRDASG